MRIQIRDREQQLLAEAVVPPGGGEFIIGRSPRCSLAVKSLTLSREHLKLRVDARGRIFASDLESTFGTLVNGERIPAGFVTRIIPGDRIELSDEIVVGFVDAPTVEQTDEEAPARPIEPAFFPFFLHRYQTAARKLVGSLERFCHGDSALTAAVEQLQTDLGAMIRELAGGIEISYALNSILNYQLLLEYALDIALTVSGTRVGFLTLYNETADRLETVIARGLDDASSGPLLEALQPMVFRCFSTMTARVVADTATDHALGPTGPEIASRARAVALAPLKINRSVIGVLVLLHPTDADPFSPRILDQLKVFTAQAAVAINNARLLHLATTDGVTGLANHKHFHQRLLEEFRRAMRHRTPLSLLSIELTELPALERRFGAALVDRMLRAFSRELRGRVRVHDLAARLAEGEFALLLPETPLEGARVLADKLRRNLLGIRSTVGGTEVSLSFAIGVAEFEPAMDRPMQLVAAADRDRRTGARSGSGTTTRGRLVNPATDPGTPEADTPPRRLADVARSDAGQQPALPNASSRDAKPAAARGAPSVPESSDGGARASRRRGRDGNRRREP